MAPRPAAGKPQTEGQGREIVTREASNRTEGGHVSLLNNKNRFNAKFANAVQIRKEKQIPVFLNLYPFLNHHKMYLLNNCPGSVLPMQENWENKQRAIAVPVFKVWSTSPFPYVTQGCCRVPATPPPLKNKNKKLLSQNL